jgi:hypothetical protein
LPDTGTLAPGKTADLVLLNANPLEDIKNTQKYPRRASSVAAFSTDKPSTTSCAIPSVPPNLTDYTGIKPGMVHGKTVLNSSLVNDALPGPTDILEI